MWTEDTFFCYVTYDSSSEIPKLLLVSLFKNYNLFHDISQRQRDKIFYGMKYLKELKQMLKTKFNTLSECLGYPAKSK